jgi:hypothetical protein
MSVLVTRARAAGILAICLLLLSSLGTTGALAAPKPFESFRATCPGYGETRITAPGNGAYTPSFIEGTNQLLVTYIVSFTVTGGGQTVATGYSERAAPLPTDSITCDFVLTWHEDGIAYVLSGYATGPIRGER